MHAYGIFERLDVSQFQIYDCQVLREEVDGAPRTGCRECTVVADAIDLLTEV